MHRKTVPSFITIILISLWGISCNNNKPAKTQFNIMETTIAKVHLAFENGGLTARQLVQMYLDRIEAYDQSTKLSNHQSISPSILLKVG